MPLAMKVHQFADLVLCGTKLVFIPRRLQGTSHTLPAKIGSSRDAPQRRSAYCLALQMIGDLIGTSKSVAWFAIGFVGIVFENFSDETTSASTIWRPLATSDNSPGN